MQGRSAHAADSQYLLGKGFIRDDDGFWRHPELTCNRCASANVTCRFSAIQMVTAARGSGIRFGQCTACKSGPKLGCSMAGRSRAKRLEVVVQNGKETWASTSRNTRRTRSVTAAQASKRPPLASSNLENIERSDSEEHDSESFQRPSSSQEEVEVARKVPEGTEEEQDWLGDDQGLGWDTQAEDSSVDPPSPNERPEPLRSRSQDTSGPSTPHPLLGKHHRGPLGEHLKPNGLRRFVEETIKEEWLNTPGRNNYRQLLSLLDNHTLGTEEDSDAHHSD